MDEFGGFYFQIAHLFFVESFLVFTRNKQLSSVPFFYHQTRVCRIDKRLPANVVVIEGDFFRSQLT